MVLTFSVLQAISTFTRFRPALRANLSKFGDSPKLFPKSFSPLHLYLPIIPLSQIIIPPSVSAEQRPTFSARKKNRQPETCLGCLSIRAKIHCPIAYFSNSLYLQNPEIRFSLTTFTAPWRLTTGCAGDWCEPRDPSHTLSGHAAIRC